MHSVVFQAIEKGEWVMKWVIEFWNRHGERLVFAGLALLLATVLYFLKMEAEAKTILIGMAMLFFNKARGTNGETRVDNNQQQ